MSERSAPRNSDSAPTSTEEILSIAASVLINHRRDLIDHVQRYRELQNPDVFVDDVIFSCFEQLRAHCTEAESPVPFDPRRPISLLEWVRVRIGRPFSRERSGLITNAIRRQRADRARLVYMDGDSLEDVPCAVDDGCEFDYGAALSRAECVLERVAQDQPRNAFVFRVHMGLHAYAVLNGDTLAELARDLHLSRPERRRISYIAASPKAAIHFGRRTLNQEITGRLVGVCPRQVRVITTRIRDLMRSSASGREPAPSREFREPSALMTKAETRELASTATPANVRRLRSDEHSHQQVQRKPKADAAGQ